MSRKRGSEELEDARERQLQGLQGVIIRAAERLGITRMEMRGFLLAFGRSMTVPSDAAVRTWIRSNLSRFLDVINIRQLMSVQRLARPTERSEGTPGPVAGRRGPAVPSASRRRIQMGNVEQIASFLAPNEASMRLCIHILKRLLENFQIQNDIPSVVMLLRVVDMFIPLDDYVLDLWATY